MLAQTQQKAASSLTEVTWCGQSLSIKSEKLRIILVRLKELIIEVKVRAVECVHIKYCRLCREHFSLCEGPWSQSTPMASQFWLISRLWRYLLVKIGHQN